jgi:uncharacterized membrane protein YqjE
LHPLVHALLAVAQNRLELLAVELQEARIRLLEHSLTSLPEP